MMSKSQKINKYIPKNLFKSTARYYARFRPAYPDDLFQSIIKEFHLDGEGKLLDLGCGTGQLAIPLAGYFEEVIALDPQREMLGEAKRIARSKKIKNVAWVQKSSDQLSPSMGKFHLVVIGRAFHWMNQKKTLAMLYKMIEPGGGLVIIGERNQDSIWQPTSRWNQAIKTNIQKYLGDERRAGEGTYKTTGKKFADFIRESPFKRVSNFYSKDTKKIWTPQETIGYLYSTSFSSKALLGKKASAFERDLKKALLKANPSGKFSKKIYWRGILVKRK